MRQAGFTLIELVVTVLIVSILAAGAVPIMQMTMQRNKETELKQSLRQIRDAIDAYKKAFDDGKVRKTVGQSGYPPSLEILEQGVVNQTDPKSRVIKFIRRIPRDPMSKEPDLKPAETWGKRSYDSDASSPREGVDVYDVYSLSQKKAINGTVYAAW
ncbi:MAG: type II secretion system protein [Candidatus Methylopumilus sp.]|jgi:general secretion pathway protein G